MNLRERSAALLLASLLGGALAGCGNGSGESSGAVSEQMGQHATTMSPGVSAAPSGLITAVEIAPEDLSVEHGPNRFGRRGDLVEGYVTLDMCGASFPSEQLRTARHQVGYVSGKDQWISSEAVAYSPGGADQAMREIRNAVQSC